MIPALPMEVSAATAGSFRNEYIDAYIRDSGQFSFGTVDGDPNSSTDDSKKLLFGWSGGGTSCTMLSINGSTALFQATSNVFSDLACVSTYTVNNILVTQTVSIEYNAYTQRYDTFKIQYQKNNNSSSAAQLGARVMLDTMLGSNDQAPFRIPGSGNVTTQTEYTGSNIPQYYTVMDSLTSPTVVASGTLYTGAPGEDKPDSDLEYYETAVYDQFRREEAEWLKKVVESEECKSAKHRIVLMHMAPIGGKNMWHGPKYSGELFLPILNKANITLMLGGHTHRYSYNKPEETGANFPILVNAHNTAAKVHINNNGVKVDMIDMTGKVVKSHLFK